VRGGVVALNRLIANASMVIIAPMLMLEWVLVLLLAAVVLTNLAERLAVPYPSLLAIAGAGLAFLPFAPQIRIEPQLALALFVAPALLDAAFDTSPRGLRANAIPVAFMAVVAVVLTTAAIAFLGWRFAGSPIAAAIALGAIVARLMRSQPTRCSGICGLRSGSGSCCRARACSTMRPRC
jgi:NhaP-type Na+/H+ or K+/H+ antiporter